MPYDRSKLVRTVITDKRGATKVVWRKPENAASSNRVNSVAPPPTPKVTETQVSIPDYLDDENEFDLEDSVEFDSLGSNLVEKGNDSTYLVDIKSDVGVSMNRKDLTILHDGIIKALEADVEDNKVTFMAESMSEQVITSIASSDGTIRVGYGHPKFQVKNYSFKEAEAIVDAIYQSGALDEVDDDVESVPDFKSTDGWSEEINLGDIWNDDSFDLSEKAEETIARIQRTRWFKDSADGGFSELEVALEDLQAAADEDDEDAVEQVWSTIYNIADNDMVMLDGLNR